MNTVNTTFAAPISKAAFASLEGASLPIETDRYVVEAIHRAESGRRAWFILAMIMLTSVAAFALVSA